MGDGHAVIRNRIMTKCVGMNTKIANQDSLYSVVNRTPTHHHQDVMVST
jgi:hypothetical protein